MKIPFAEVKKVLSAGWSASGDEGGEVRLAVSVACDAPLDLARALRASLRPRLSTGRLYVSGFGGALGMPPVNGLSDAALVLCGADVEAAACIYRSYREIGVPCAVVAPSPQMARDLSVRFGAWGDVLVSTAERVPECVGAWLVGTLEDRAGVLGANFPCCRRARARGVVRAAARDNALVGALVFLKDADMPVMLANQAAMAVRLAGLYGVPLDASRAVDLAALAVWALLMRSCARRLTSALPLPEFAVKAAVAAAGTYAAGGAAAAYYACLAEHGISGARRGAGPSGAPGPVCGGEGERVG